MQQEKYKGWLLKLQGNSKFSQVWDNHISSPLPLHCFELLKYFVTKVLNNWKRMIHFYGFMSVLS